MRWVCHLYPQLPLEVLHPPADKPCVVVEPKGNRRPVTYANDVALARGVRLGMSQSSVSGLVPDVAVLFRKTDAEQLAMTTLACRGYGFGSPVVVDFEQHAVWVETEKSIGFFGGWKRLAEALLRPDPQLPYAVRIGAAPTLSAAYLFALVYERPRRPVTRLTDLPGALEPIPLDALPFEGSALEMLHSAGLRRIGEVLALSTASLGKRIGKQNALALQRLLGQVPEVWEAWQPATQYRRRWEFDEPIETTEALLFPLRIILTEFVAYLKVRDISIQHFELKLVGSRKRIVRHPIGLQSATRDVKRILLILRERLDKLEMEEGVMEVSVEADRFEPAAAIQDDLFSEIGAQVGERLTELCERLSARLGSEAVRRLAVDADQRPEIAQGSTETTSAVRGMDHPQRPLWLLEKPQRMTPRRFLSVPERIELGWWDESGPSIERDYVVTEDQYGRLCWSYRDAGAKDWFLHGLWQ